MKIAIMQPYLFPYIGYFQLINSVDEFVIHDDVQWIKGGWINRNRILFNDAPKLITLSVKKRSNYDDILQYEISEDHANRHTFLNKIKASYSMSPFFNEVFPMISEIVLNEEKIISKYIKNSIDQICKYLNVDTPCIFSSQLNKGEFKNKDKVIEICKAMGANHYINPIGGIELYEKEYFKERGIQLNFLKTLEFDYKQYNDNFTPNLSIIDVLMFNSPEQIRIMLTNYELK